MRDVAILSHVQAPSLRDSGGMNEVEMLLPTLGEALSRAGLTRQEIDFTCSGSCDYLAGASFAFVSAVDTLGACPPIAESHVEMDAAWALYEAWIKIQCGHADTALIFGFGKSSPGELTDVLTLQLDPYYLAPLWPDTVSLAALQARALLEGTDVTERDMAEVVARSRRNALNNPRAQLRGEVDADKLLAEPMYVSPLRKHDCPPISDGASAMVIAAADVARRVCERPAWIRGIDHRIESHHLGTRDLTRSTSTEIAGRKAGVGDGPIDVAELHAPFSHQELILARALGLGDDVEINPSGGALGANVIMAAGLDRIGEAASRIIEGKAKRAVGHATSGPCLQQNLVAVLEGE
jgi:acetyl-CoA acetyltransferase